MTTFKTDGGDRSGRSSTKVTRPHERDRVETPPSETDAS